MEKRKVSTTNKNDTLSLLVFTVDWVPECKSLMPKIKKITQEYDISLLELNGDCDHEVAVAAGAVNFPTTLLYRNGTKVFSVEGDNEEKIIELIKKFY